MQILHLLHYSDRARQTLKETLLENESVFHTEFETTSAFNSIAKILAHCIGAEERWLKLRIERQELPVFYEARSAETVEAMYADWEPIRDHTYDFLAQQTPESLIAVREYLPIPLSLEAALFHIVNHENYHRGQIVMMLQRMGIDPPNLDYPVMMKDEAK